MLRRVRRKTRLVNTEVPSRHYATSTPANATAAPTAIRHLASHFADNFAGGRRRPHHIRAPIQAPRSHNEVTDVARDFNRYRANEAARKSGGGTLDAVTVSLTSLGTFLREGGYDVRMGNGIAARLATSPSLTLRMLSSVFQTRRFGIVTAHYLSNLASSAFRDTAAGCDARGLVALDGLSLSAVGTQIPIEVVLTNAIIAFARDAAPWQRWPLLPTASRLDARKVSQLESTGLLGDVLLHPNTHFACPVCAEVLHFSLLASHLFSHGSREWEVSADIGYGDMDYKAKQQLFSRAVNGRGRGGGVPSRTVGVPKECTACVDAGHAVFHDDTRAAEAAAFGAAMAQSDEDMRLLASSSSRRSFEHVANIDPWRPTVVGPAWSYHDWWHTHQKDLYDEEGRPYLDDAVCSLGFMSAHAVAAKLRTAIQRSRVSATAANVKREVLARRNAETDSDRGVDVEALSDALDGSTSAGDVDGKAWAHLDVAEGAHSRNADLSDVFDMAAGEELSRLAGAAGPSEVAHGDAEKDTVAGARVVMESLLQHRRDEGMTDDALSTYSELGTDFSGRGVPVTLRRGLFWSHVSRPSPSSLHVGSSETATAQDDEPAVSGGLFADIFAADHPQEVVDSAPPVRLFEGLRSYELASGISNLRDLHRPLHRSSIKPPPGYIARWVPESSSPGGTPAAQTAAGSAGAGLEGSKDLSVGDESAQRTHAAGAVADRLDDSADHGKATNYRHYCSHTLRTLRHEFSARSGTYIRFTSIAAAARALVATDEQLANELAADAKATRTEQHRRATRGYGFIHNAIHLAPRQPTFSTQTAIPFLRACFALLPPHIQRYYVAGAAEHYIRHVRFVRPTSEGLDDDLDAEVDEDGDVEDLGVPASRRKRTEGADEDAADLLVAVDGDENVLRSALEDGALAALHAPPRSGAAVANASKTTDAAGTHVAEKGLGTTDQHVDVPCKHTEPLAPNLLGHARKTATIFIDEREAIAGLAPLLALEFLLFRTYPSAFNSKRPDDGKGQVGAGDRSVERCKDIVANTRVRLMALQKNLRWAPSRGLAYLMGHPEVARFSLNDRDALQLAAACIAEFITLPLLPRHTSFRTQPQGVHAVNAEDSAHASEFEDAFADGMDVGSAASIAAVAERAQHGRGSVTKAASRYWGALTQPLSVDHSHRRRAVSHLSLAVFPPAPPTTAEHAQLTGTPGPALPVNEERPDYWHTFITSGPIIPQVADIDDDSAARGALSAGGAPQNRLSAAADFMDGADLGLGTAMGGGAAAASARPGEPTAAAAQHGGFAEMHSEAEEDTAVDALFGDMEPPTTSARHGSSSGNDDGLSTPISRIAPPARRGGTVVTDVERITSFLEASQTYRVMRAQVAFDAAVERSIDPMFDKVVSLQALVASHGVDPVVMRASHDVANEALRLEQEPLMDIIVHDWPMMGYRAALPVNVLDARIPHDSALLARAQKSWKNQSRFSRVTVRAGDFVFPISAVRVLALSMEFFEKVMRDSKLQKAFALNTFQADALATVGEQQALQRISQVQTAENMHSSGSVGEVSRAACTAPPLPWSDYPWRASPFRSGLLAPMIRWSRVTGRVSAWQRDAATFVMHSSATSALDAYGSVRWEVDDFVLNAIRQAHKAELDGGTLPAALGMIKEPEVTTKSAPFGSVSAALTAAAADDTDPNSTYEYEKSASMEDFVLFQSIVKSNVRLQYGLTDLLTYIDRVRGDGNFFSAFSADFRGRVYSLHGKFNHMGPDHVRALFRFADRKPLGEEGAFWLKAHVGALWGLDKQPFRDRVEFAETQSFRELAIAIKNNPNDPALMSEWLGQDNPFLAAQATVEYARALEHYAEFGSFESFESGLPVHADGSCNGFQHFTAMTRDRKAGMYVNLIPADRPQDVYSGVVDYVRQTIEKIATTNIVPWWLHAPQHVLRAPSTVAYLNANGYKWELLPAAIEHQMTIGMLEKHKSNGLGFLADAHFLQTHNLVVRKLLKQSVMTQVYGVTYRGAVDQIARWLKRSLQDSLNITVGLASESADLTVTHQRLNRISRLLAICTFRGVTRTFHGAISAMKYLNDIAYIASIVRPNLLPTRMATPVGFPLVQPYSVEQGKSLVTVLGHLSVRRDETWATRIDSRKQSSAFAPNFVHALDASHCHDTAITCRERGITFASVHDSYWTHACDYGKLSHVLRSSFVRLHSTSWLDEQHRFNTVRHVALLRHPHPSCTVSSHPSTLWSTCVPFIGDLSPFPSSLPFLFPPRTSTGRLPLGDGAVLLSSLLPPPPVSSRSCRR